MGGYYTGDYRGRVNNDRSARGDNIRVIDPFDDEPPPDDETPDQARKDLDDIFRGSLTLCYSLPNEVMWILLFQAEKK
ncbi:MAG: hypothetical protein ACLUSP_02035 [Christensenellales bacterium]